MRRRQWWVLLLAAAVALIAAATVLLKTPKGLKHSASVVRHVDAGAPCSDEGLVPTFALSRDDSVPVVLWAAGDVRLFFDGHPTFSSPEEPKSFSAGEHELRAVTASGTSLKLKIRLDPFTPAVFHLENDPYIGLSFVQAGSICLSCANALAPVSLAFSPPARPAAPACEEAARAIRLGDWQTAAKALRHVGPRERQSGTYQRLAATTLWLSGQPSLSEAVLAKLAERSSGDWASLWKSLLKQREQENARQGQVLNKQWNKLTDKFNSLREVFVQDALAAEAAANGRFIELYKGFKEAQTAGDIPVQEQVLRSAQEVLAAYVKALRASRPGECDFQARVTQAL